MEECKGNRQINWKKYDIKNKHQEEESMKKKNKNTTKYNKPSVNSSRLGTQT